MRIGKNLFAACAGILACLGFAANIALADSPNYSAASYVQDGLVGLWDAEENAGFGQHDESPAIWKDLSGRGRDMTVTTSGRFTEKGFKKIAGGQMAYRDENVDDALTVEVVVSGVPVGAYSKNWAVVVYTTNLQMIAVQDVVDDSNATNRQIIVSYWNRHGHNTSNRPDVSSISVLYGLDTSGKLVATGSRHCGLTDEGRNDGMDPVGGQGLCVGCRAGAQEYRGDYTTTGYVVHSIRFYNRQLTDAERQRNLLVDHIRFGSPCYTSLDKLDFTWTGDANDGKFSSSANWEDGLSPIPTDVTLGKLNLSAKGAGSIANDVGALTVRGLYVGQADGSANPLTLTGEPIAITDSADVTKSSQAYLAVLSNGCPLTVDLPLAFTGTKVAQYNAASLTLNGNAFASNATQFTFCSVASSKTTFNGKFEAPQATIFTLGGSRTVDFYGPLVADTLEVGVKGEGETVNFHASGNKVDDLKACLYGSLTLSAMEALPVSYVFRWKGDYPSDYKYGKDLFKLLASQTADRIDAPCMKDGNGAIIPRQNIVSENTKVTLTLKGTDNAVSYGVLKCAEGCDLNLTWAPTGSFSQTFADQAHTMRGALTVKGGTIVSAGANSFASVTALDVGDGATFAVRASTDNAAANPFTGVAKPALTLSGSGVIEVAAGVTVPFSTGFARGVLLAADKYQALDGTDATAKKVAWVTGGGLVQITTAADGTSWKDASVSGDWDDPDNWSNGLPDLAKPVYLTAEGGNYTVTMKSGTDWPLNLVIRGANAKLLVGAGQTVEFNGTGKTASVSIEEGGTLSVAGSLSIVDYKGTFTVGSTTAVTSRIEVVAGGDFYYTPRYQNVYPISVNVGGALDIAGGILSVPAYGSSSNALDLRGGALLTSGAGRVGVGARNLTPEDSAKIEFASGLMVFSGTSTLANLGTKDLNVTFAPMAPGESMSAAFRDSAVYGLKGQDFKVGSPNTTTRLAFDSSSQEHACLGYGVRVRAEGDSGDAELCVSDGKVWNDGRGIDIADDNKSDVVTHGRLVQTGGWINNKANNGGWTDQGKPNGLTIGYGANASGAAGRVAFGEMVLSGGTNQNVNGMTLVGTGYGAGTVIQTGGFNWHDSETEAFGIGAAGGLGRWTVSNGTLRVNANAYIGGFNTNVFAKAKDFAKPIYRWPDTRHDADGALVMAGGEVDFKKNLILGADGLGMVERIGRDGTFAIGGDLVLSNATANAQSGGMLKFVCAADGVKPINVVGKVTFREGAKMSIDISNWTNVARRQWLLKASDFENPIAVEDIEITGRTEATQEVVLKLSPAGYSIGVPRGMCITIR